MILYFHGGSWLYGSKESFGSDAYNSCAQFGITAATVNYRFTTFGDVDACAILDDIQAAVAHIKNFAATKGLNIKKMMLYGYSAGAHLSLLYGYTRREVSPVRPVCVFDKSGPASLANLQYFDWSSGLMMPMSCLCGFWYTKETAAYEVEPLLRVSPWTYVDSNSLPTVVCHGAQDDVVATYTIVIYGDVTGDGYVDAFDVSNLSEYINNFDEPSGIAFKKSVDIVEDGFLDATDLAYLISITNFE